MAMDVVDDEIKGAEMQFVEVELEAGEAASRSCPPASSAAKASSCRSKTALFGGEGLFFAKLSGPGTIWLQSLPFSRQASRVSAAASQRGGRREESSLGGLVVGGGLLGGILGGNDE